MTAGAMLGATACRGGSRGASALAETAAAASPRRLDRIGIQLYSVRRELQRDFSGTLARLAAMGYSEVEFAGYFGKPPSVIRAELERHKLVAPSTHGALDLVRTSWDKTLDDAAAIGHRYVTINWLPAETRRTLDDWRRIADDFNRAGAVARARGVTLAYHNYDVTLKPLEGVVPMDLLLERTDPTVVTFQMDVYWLVVGGADPVAYVRRYPGRFTMLHVKDSAGPPRHAQVDVGAGTIDFRAILRETAGQGHPVKHAFVEHDEPAEPMQFAKRSFDYLKALEY